MAYRRGEQRPPYSERRDPGRGGGAPTYRPATGFVCAPPGLPPPQYPQPGQPAVVYRAPMPAPHQGAFHPGAAQVVYRAPSPGAPPLGGYARSTPVTIRAPPASPSSAPVPYQPAQVAAPQAAAPSPSSSAAALAKEVEQKLFVTETALAPPAAAESAAAAAPVSKKGPAHPARPGYGAAGKKVMIRANHFLVNVVDNNLFHYDVSINPESKSRATNREVLNELIKLHGKTSLGGKLPAYDGGKSLYTAGSLPFKSEEFVVKRDDPEKKDKERAEREYKITIRIAGRTDLYHLQQFLLGRQRDMPQKIIQVLDVVLRESPSWNYVTVFRSCFSTQFGHQGDIREGLECWRGYYQSLRPTQMGLSLNIDISATSIFKPMTVIQFVEEFLNIRDISRPLSDRDHVKIKKALRGVRIETNHQEDQIRRYKITGIIPIPMSELIIPVDENGTRMNVVQYFWDRYNYRLKYASWPCLQAGSDSCPVYLPMEVCKIVERKRYSKKLNDKQVTSILRATCQRPQQVEQSIHEMVLHNKYTEDRFAQEFGIKVCNELVTVPAHVLPPPMEIINGGTVRERFCGGLIPMCNVENALRDVHRRTTELLVKDVNGSPEKIDKREKIFPGTVLDRQIGHCRELDSNICASGLQRTPNLMKKINISSGLATRHPRRVFNLAVALVLMVAFAIGPKVALAKCEQEAHDVASLCGGTGIHGKCCFALKRSLDGGDPLCLCSLANNNNHLKEDEMELNTNICFITY